jgi:hypothetical protein
VIAFGLSGAGWTVLGLAYLVAVVFLAVECFRRGHYWLFGIGFFIPLLWIVGVLIAPTPAAYARHHPAPPA